MDRLICGDVGFGKTEVALRAIFCVVSAGKQAMVLAPTIVLAKQHFDVVSERFSKYPDIKVGLLSRFQVCKYICWINLFFLKIIFLLPYSTVQTGHLCLCLSSSCQGSSVHSVI